jgi:hypothetical protein
LLRPYATHKLSFRSKPCIFIGYGSNQKGYRCLDPLTHKVYLSRNVIFDETKFPAKSPSSSLGSCKVTASPGNSLVLIPSQLHSDFNSIAAPSNRIEDMPNPIDTSSPHPSQTPLIHPPSPLPSQHDPHAPQPEHFVTATTFDESSTHLATPSDSSPSLHQLPQPFLPHFSSTPHSTLPEPPPTRIVTRSQTGHSKPKHFPGFKMFHSIKHPLQVLHTIHLPPEPSTFKQAASKPEWIHAMNLEYQALISNQTWSLCPRPSNHNVIRNKWVFKVKQKADGSVDRYKARLVAKGFDQLGGIDYYETFSPVIKPTTIRLVLALAVQFDWPIHQLDVSNAFLHGVLDEEVYMEQPQGFVHSSYPDYVCRLHKSIYGLKQAPRAWFTRLSQALLDIGFTGSQLDPSLFTYHTTHVHICLLVYVDDIILTGNHKDTISCILSKLKSEFALKDLGALNYFLGIQAI